MRRSAVARAALARPARGRGRARGSLTERAYRALEEQIVTLKIPPGTVVSEALLGQRLGIGRTPIREALWRLARERLVTIFPHRGIIVSEIEVKWRILRAWSLVAGAVLVVGLAGGVAVHQAATTPRCPAIVDHPEWSVARRWDEALLDAIRRALPAPTVHARNLFHTSAAMWDAWAAYDPNAVGYFVKENHTASDVAAARNEFATSALSLVQGLSRRFWYLHYKEAADMPLAARLHADVARAIARGDRDAAGRASDALIDYIEDFARATIGID